MVRGRRACWPVSASRCSTSGSRSSTSCIDRPGPGATGHRPLGHRDGQRHQPHRRARRAGRRHRRHRRRARSSSTASGSTSVGLLAQPNIGPLVAIIVLGMCLGFLPHNFHPARIFMGDGGALLLGLLMAASTIVVGGRADPNQPFSGQTYFFFAPLVHPARDPRRADPRHGVRHHPPGHAAARASPRPTRTTCTTGSCGSVTASAAACDPLVVDGDAVGASCCTPPTPGEGNGAVPLGMAALGLALYTVLHPQLRRAAPAGVTSARRLGPWRR